MHIEVNGTRLWFDVDGPRLVLDGAGAHERPTVILLHGGPGGFDHTYLKPHFGRLAEHAQVVYLDLREHGRSARHDSAPRDFALCADDVRAFCDALGIADPIVFGHSMGGFVAMLYGARHPGHARALILQSTMARFDMDRTVAGFRGVAGDEVAALARRSYGGDPVTEEQWAAVFAAFGPRVPTPAERAHTIRNPDINARGGRQLVQLDVVDQLARIRSPTLVYVGDLDPITPPAAAREIVDALPPGVGRLEVLEGAGHFPWLDHPTNYWRLISNFVTAG